MSSGLRVSTAGITIDTPYLRALSTATMVLGCTAMIVLTGALAQVFTALQWMSEDHPLTITPIHPYSDKSAG